MTKYSDIIKQLELKRISFENDTYRKPTPREIKRWNDIFCNNSSGLSSGRKSVQNRAHILSKRIQQELGEGVMLLVLSLKPKDALARLESQPFVDALRGWWEGVSHPDALAIVASECFPLSCSRRAVDLGKTRLAPTNQSAAIAFGALISLQKSIANTF
jgi:hypothetical protein